MAVSVSAAAPEAGSSIPITLPPDVRLISDLAATVPTGDPVRGLFDVRFPVGVRLRNATPGEPGSLTGSTWLMASAPDGPGWQPIGSWGELAGPARTAGRGGLTLLWFAAGASDAFAVHNARDGAPWLIHVRRGQAPEVVRLDEFDPAGHAPPVAVAAIDWCAEVRHPSYRPGGRTEPC